MLALSFFKAQSNREKYAAKWKFMQEKLKGDISLSYVHTKSRIAMHFLTLIVYDIPSEEFYNLFKIKNCQVSAVVMKSIKVAVGK